MSPVRQKAKTIKPRNDRSTAAAKGGRAPKAKIPSPAPAPASVRGRMEELALQADLAVMDIRDEVRVELEAAENAWLAARSRLEVALADTDTAFTDLRSALRKVVSDLASAPAAVDAAIERTRGSK